MHEDLTRAINDMIKGPKSIPTWLTSGITFLLSQGKDTQYPKNYRLITCLLTMYKFLKAALKNRFYKHSEVTFFQKNSKAVTEYLGDVKTSCWWAGWFIVSVETSRASIYGMDWLQESIWQPTSHLDSHCRGDVPNMSNNKTILWRHQLENGRLKCGCTALKGNGEQEKWLLKEE